MKQVVFITGSARGLGLTYARHFLEKTNPKVVIINDIDEDVCQKALQDLKHDFPNQCIDVVHGDVVEGQKIIQNIVAKYGRIDVLVHNAGMLRDRGFLNISKSDWQMIYQVHMFAVFLLTQEAWKSMKENKFGRIIFVTSPSGLFGNNGQANYSSMKMAQVGLMNTLAKEGKKYNILCNAIAPIAATRMTEKLIPPPLLQKLQPDFIAPVVLYLSDERCKLSKKIFQVAGGWVSESRIQQSEGFIFKDHEDMTFDNIEKNMKQITQMETGSFYPDGLQEIIMKVVTLKGKF